MTMQVFQKFPALRRFCTLLFCWAMLAPLASATWSIVVINRATGEVCVACATCIGGKFPLKKWVPVIVVEKGAAAAQSFVDSLGGNRMLIWNKMHGGVVPERILDLLEKQDGGHQTRQYGIVSFDGDPVTFTGTGAGLARYGVQGEVDDLVYAIQGNVIAGNEVVLEAEKTLRNSTGDLGQRVMAAMETARLWGGDGRCSCSPTDADGCGSPPPSFTHSAYTSFIVLARPGDTDGICNKDLGCANGDYYLSKVFKGQGPSDPDPVIELQVRYDDWRLNKLGKPDHYLSQVTVDREILVADGVSQASVEIRLLDIDDVALTSGGHEITVEQVSPGPVSAMAGPATDHGDGSYSFDMVATQDAGPGEFQIKVRYGPTSEVFLRPLLQLETAPLTELHAGNSSLSAGEPILETVGISFLVGVVLLGAIAIWKSRDVHDQSDFAVAGRSLSPWMMVCTMLAVWIGTGSIVGNAEQTYETGMAAMLLPTATIKI